LEDFVWEDERDGWVDFDFEDVGDGVVAILVDWYGLVMFGDDFFDFVVGVVDVH